MRIAMPVPEISDPATYDQVAQSNISRHIVEYLTITGPDNVTRPYLAESWEPSDDLRTWTFRLRHAIRWHNGDEFTTEDVEFNFRRWLDPRTGSSNQALFAGMLEESPTAGAVGIDRSKTLRRMREGAFERVDDYTFRLHLSEPALAIPENLYNYPTAILHRGFADDGGDLTKWAIGTGPFTLAEFSVGERAILHRVQQSYWANEIFLDEIHYQDYGSASDVQIRAFAPRSKLTWLLNSMCRHSTWLCR
ncbi:MAG: ABC transporter substrate-binding protein [Geminicoccaceae bacterium]